ncbi:MAG: TonB-dependent receptor plug domain-containing protein [Bacteroidia bacterium]
MSPVSVEATIIQQARSTADATRFAADSLGQYPSAGLGADAILRQAEGLYMRNYGGHGGVRTLSVRGFGAPQTTVSINGIPYASPQSGVVNLGNFYSEGFSEIRVTRNGSSGNASLAPLGGNVNFALEPDKSRLAIKAGRGAFGEGLAGMHASLKRKQFQAQGGIQLLQADDNFPFQLNGESGTRSGADFRTLRIMAQARYSDSLWSVSWFGLGYSNDQGVPGPVLTGNTGNGTDRLETEDAFQALSIVRITGGFNSWRPYQLKADLAYHVNELRYSLPTATQRYMNQDLLGQVTMTHLGSRSRTQTLLQVHPAWLQGNNLAIGFVPIDRVQRTVWRAGISRQAYYTLGKQNIGYTLTTRLGRTTADGWLPEGSLGLSWKFPKRSWELFAHGNIGTRLPAFNELYYFGYGNAALPPERIRGGDFGLLHTRKVGAWRLSGKLALFGNVTVDKIVAIPVNPAVWSTRAIGRSRSLGAESSLELVQKKSRLYLSYTLQDVRDLTIAAKPYLPYTPPEIMNYGLVQTFGALELGIHGHYSGWRFVLPVIEESAFLPAYHLLDLNVGYTFQSGGWTYRFRLDGENVLNTRYEVIKSYPMPPASWRASILVVF